MITSLRPTHSNRTLRAVGAIAVIASLASACGASTDTDSRFIPGESTVVADAQDTAVVDANATTPEAEQPQQNIEADQASDTAEAPDQTQTPDTTPPADTTPPPDTTPPADTTPPPDTTPQPNLAPTLNTVRVTHVGVNVTVGINASDPDNDNLSLTVVGVLGANGKQFDHAAEADAAIFEMPFDKDARGTVTITTSVSDGINTTTQTDQIDIAPRQSVTFHQGAIEASTGCFLDTAKLTFQPQVEFNQISTYALSATQENRNVTSPMTFTSQNRRLQLFPDALSAEFEEETGFLALITVKGQLGDVPINHDNASGLAGSFESSRFESPSNPSCRVKLEYNITTQQAA
jgi:hypothetical protein